MIEGEARRHQSDEHRVNTNINPSAVADAEVEVERQAKQQAPSSHGALSTTQTWVVEGRPRVVDEQPLDPVGHGTVLVHGSGAEGDESEARCDEDGVSKHFKVESIFCFTKGGVGGFEGQEPSP